MYTVECGDFEYTTLSLVQACRHARRIGLARCEEARVISPSGEIVYTY